MQTSLIINATDTNNKANQKTLTYVNSEASGADLQSLAIALNGLTDNTYVGANRVDKTALNAKTTPTLTLSESSANCTDIVAACTGDAEPYCYEVTVNYNGDGKLTTENPAIRGRDGAVLSDVYQINNVWKLRVAWVVTDTGYGDVTVKAAETDNFAAAQTIFSIT